MKTLIIQIPNMQSSHCQMRVNNALNNILNATDITMRSGVARVVLPKESTSEEVICIIENAGYYVTEIEEVTADAIEKTES